MRKPAREVDAVLS